MDAITANIAEQLEAEHQAGLRLLTLREAQQQDAEQQQQSVGRQSEQVQPLVQQQQEQKLGAGVMHDVLSRRSFEEYANLPTGSKAAIVRRHLINQAFDSMERSHPHIIRGSN